MIKLTIATVLVFTVSASARRNISMISDGVYVGASMVTCKPPYGFLPRTTELLGLILLVVVYQYLLSLGMKYVSDGSDLFLKTFGPGLIGASLFNFLGTIPQVILIVVSRLSGDTENAKAQSAIGMSILAGGAVMNLTLIWGIVVALGSHDISDTQSTTTSDVKLSTLTCSGVKTDVDTSYTARIMMISIVPLVIVQLTNVVSSSSAAHLIVLISLIVSIILFITYNLYQDTEEGQSLLVQKSTMPNTADLWKSYMKAASLIFLGIAISSLLAMPLIESVVAVATATSIPPFFIPYVIVPLTITSRSAGMTICSARKKTDTSISLTLSQIYGSVFVGNVMGLTMFLIVVYIRDIRVDASAEFLVAIVICTMMGVFTSFRTTFSKWTSYLVIFLYPVSLLTLYVLTTTLGWS